MSAWLQIFDVIKTTIVLLISLLFSPATCAGPRSSSAVTAYTDWGTLSSLNQFHHSRTVVTTVNPELVVDAD